MFDDINHDTLYLDFLKNIFGTTGIPMFGIMICVFSFIGIFALILISAGTVTVKPKIIYKTMATKFDKTVVI